MRFSKAFLLVTFFVTAYFTRGQVFNSQNLTFSPALDIYAKIEWVDIDRDGNLDVLAFRWDSNSFDNNSVSVFKNTGNAFEQVTAPFGTGVPHLNPASYALADYDLDGDVDILIVDYQTLRIAKNNGDFSFLLVN